MTFAQLLTELARHHIGLTVTASSIKTSIPVNQLPDHIREALRLNKADILAIMNKPLKVAGDPVEYAVSLGGVVVGEVDKVPGEPVMPQPDWQQTRLSFGDWLKGQGEIICPGDEFGF